MAENKKKDENFLKNIAHLKKRALEVKFDLDLAQYKPLENIGIGAYGVVCSAIHKKTNDRVAIKKIPNVFDVKDIAKRTYREIKILKHFKHDNIIHIREILKPKETYNDFRDVYVVFDLMESDLHKIIYSKQELTEEHVRYFLYQILRGLKYIHSAHVIHRDLKPSNLLVNEDCQLRIGDFGMARGFSSSPVEPNYFMTQYVATRWYRAPEIMLSLIEYGAGVDMWSVGCIFAEMLGRKHLFPGKDSISQIKLIVGVVGSPSNDLLQLCHSPIIKTFFQEMGNKAAVPWPKLYPKASKKAIHLLGRMLTLHPKDRITVEQALVHPYLNKYHDSDDEPICVPTFNFDFEKEDLKLPKLREVIHSEVMEYHKPRTPTLSFNAFLRPVLKSPDTQPPDIFKPMKEEGTSLLVTEIKREPTLADSTENEAKNLSSAEIKVKDENLQQKIIITATSDDEVFKRPLSAKNNKESPVHVNTGNLLKTESADIEMLSAKSVDGKQPMSARDSEDKSKENTEPIKEEKHKTISEDTKNLIKAALKNASFKKRTDSVGDDDRPKPITAAQRQKEREDKRRKKKVKTMEKKKKEKKTMTKEELLTSEDKEMLQRWAKMQQVNVPIAPKPEVKSSCMFAGVTEVKGQSQTGSSISSTDQASIIEQHSLLSTVKNELVNFGSSKVNVSDLVNEVEDKGQIDKFFPNNQMNVQQQTLNLLQQRLLMNNPNNEEKPQVQNEQTASFIPEKQDGGLDNKGNVSETTLNVGINESLERSGSSDYSVDFSNVQLGDLDFLTLVSSPKVMNNLTQNISADNTNISSTASNTQFDALNSHLLNGAPNSGGNGGFLQRICSENVTVPPQEQISDGFAINTDIHQNRSPSHLSVSPNYRSQISPSSYYSSHSPESQHSISPNQNLSPNPQFSTTNVPPSQQQAQTHFQPNIGLPFQQFMEQSHTHGQNVTLNQQFGSSTQQTQNQSMPQQQQTSHFIGTSPNMSHPQHSQQFLGPNQSQNQSGRQNQHFIYRNQSDAPENSSSNSNSNSPPTLSINTRQAQMTFQQQIFNEPMAGPSDAGSHIHDTRVDLVALLAKQLSRSNVDDLCPPLALTPRGTGGGYGVGVDLDALMGGHEAEGQGAEPSPLSSSILADWMEVTGNMNIDMEALEQELTSPMALSYNDLNMYSS